MLRIVAGKDYDSDGIKALAQDEAEAQDDQARRLSVKEKTAAAWTGVFLVICSPAIVLGSVVVFIAWLGLGGK